MTDTQLVNELKAEIKRTDYTKAALARRVKCTPGWLGLLLNEKEPLSASMREALLVELKELKNMFRGNGNPPDNAA